MHLALASLSLVGCFLIQQVVAGKILGMIPESQLEKLRRTLVERGPFAHVYDIKVALCLSLARVIPLRRFRYLDSAVSYAAVARKLAIAICVADAMSPLLMAYGAMAFVGVAVEHDLNDTHDRLSVLVFAFRSLVNPQWSTEAAAVLLCGIAFAVAWSRRVLRHLTWRWYARQDRWVRRGGGSAPTH